MEEARSSAAALALSLLTARAVRERAHEMLALGEAGALPHWRVDRTKLDRVAAYVLDTMRRNYPSLEIPFHARWRHFAAGGVDRWAKLAASTPWRDGASRARGAFDLAIVSVLLDAGAGPDWRYRGEDGSLFSRSEGLALASFEMFARGAFSADPQDKLRADASRLLSIEASEIAKGFQASAENPLVGLKGAPLFCVRSGARLRQRRRSSPRGTLRGRAASSTISSARARRLPASRRPPSSRPCSPISGRSGRRACRLPASRSGIAGAMPRFGARTPRTASCPSTSSRNGFPIP